MRLSPQVKSRRAQMRLLIFSNVTWRGVEIDDDMW